MYELRHLDSKVSITCDCWTSKSQNSYLGVTCHYIDNNMKFKNKVIALRYVMESKTADYLHENLVKILEQWKIQEKVIKVFNKHPNKLTYNSLFYRLTPLFVILVLIYTQPSKNLQMF